MNLKPKDLLVYGVGTTIGLLGIYLVFGTNIIVDHGTEPVAKNGGMNSNFNNFNTNVPQQVASTSSEKIDLIDEKLAKEQRDSIARLKEKSNSSQDIAMNDVTTYVNGMGKDLESARKKDREELLKKMKDQVAPVQERSKVAPVIQEKQNGQLKVGPAKSSGVGVSVKKEGENGSTGQVKKRRRTKKLFDSTEVEGGDKTNQVGKNKKELVKEETVYSAKASVYGPQTADVGKRITLMLQENLSTPYGDLEAGSLIDGFCSINQGQGNSRLMITINSIRVSGKPVKVSGRVTDLDGLDGLPISGLTDEQYVQKNVTSQAVGQAAQKLGIPIISQGTQMATQRKMQSRAIPLTGDEKIIIVIE